MPELFDRLAQNFSFVYFAEQFLVIIVLFLLGFLIENAFKSGSGEYDGTVDLVIESFPVGLSAFIIEAYFMLSAGIPYNTFSVSVVIAIDILAVAMILSGKGKLKTVFQNGNRKTLYMMAAAFAILALIACSGIVPVSISNDSMYYFHEYPRDIVYFGHLRDQFDSFLTDTGLGSVVIETLPFLFGFNESFGIREFMHICFIIFTGRQAYLFSKKVSAAAALMLIVAFSSPVYILGHWAMANMYFMEMFFIAASMAFKVHETPDEDSRLSLSLIPCALVSVACALLRMEGGIFILLLVGCFTFTGIKGKDLIAKIIIPILLLLVIYEIRIYAFYKIDNPYTFLSPGKAVLQAAAFVAVIVYVAFIRNRLPGKIVRLMPAIMIIALICANAVLFLYNRELYTANLRAFYGNLTGQSGWGMLPHLTIAGIVILAGMKIYFVLRKTGKSGAKHEECKPARNENEKAEGNRIAMEAVKPETYFTVLTVGFVLVTVAVSFMRGDALDVSIGDSGNRVMMQAAPLILYTLYLYFVRLYERFGNEEN